MTVSITAIAFLCACALIFFPLVSLGIFAMRRRMFFKKLKNIKLDSLPPNELAELALKLEFFKHPAPAKLASFWMNEGCCIRTDDLYLEFHEKLCPKPTGETMAFNPFEELEKMRTPPDKTNDSFYENFKGRVKSELTDKEKVFIKNHALTDEELKNVNDNSMNLFGDGFVFVRYFSHESFNVNDNEVISSVADYLHELPFQLKGINTERKLTFCFVEFLKSLDCCCSSIVINKSFLDSKKMYVDFFEKFNASTQNILQILNESKELEK